MILKRLLLRDNVANEESRRNTQGEDGDVDDNDWWEVEHKATIGFGGRQKTFKLTISLGVTLEDLKSAEQLVKKKQQQENATRTTELQQLASAPAPPSPSPPTASTHLSTTSSHSAPSTTVTTSATLVSCPLPMSNSFHRSQSPSANCNLLLSESDICAPLAEFTTELWRLIQSCVVTGPP